MRATLPPPLRRRGFRLFMIAQLASLIGDFFMPIALAFAVLDLTGSASDLGLVLAAQVAPAAVLLLVGGAWADRRPRRALMVATDLVRAGTQGTVAVLLLTGHAHVWELVALQAAWGTAEALYRPASAAYWPELLDPDEVNAGAAIEATSWSTAVVGGPLIAGVIVATLGAGWAIALDAATFLVSAGCITATRPLADRTRAEEGGSFLGDIREGWRELRSRRWLVISFGLSAVRSLICMGPMFVLGPVLAAAHLGGASGWATVCVCWGIGGVVGSVAPLRLRPARPLVGAFLGMALIGPALFVWLVAPDSLPLVAGAAFVGGLGFFYDEAVVTALIPEHVPDEFRSRVNAYAWIAWYVSQPLGMAAAAGVASTLLDPRLILATAGLTVMAGSLVAIAVPAVRRLPRAREAV